MWKYSITIGIIALAATRLLAVGEPETKPTPVHVFFEKSKVMSTFDIESFARSELKKVGKITDGMPCAINIQLNSRGGDCAVLFSNGFGREFHQVLMSSSGEIREIRSGKATEGPGSDELVKEVENVGIKVK